MYGGIGNTLWFGKGAREWRNVLGLLKLGLNCFRVEG